MENKSFGSLQHSSSWNIKRSNLQKEYYPSLTEADLDFAEVHEAVMLEKIHQKLGKPINELKQVMEKNSPDRLY